ncbi:hypothetical protein [Micromonospora profundi]|uniref:hypothetical protein n=1 Tax=Micromonospora profundi TaxID=1420889 RepID=UPI00364AEA92
MSAAVEMARYNLNYVYHRGPLRFPDVAVTSARPKACWAFATTRTTRHFHRVDTAWVAWPPDATPLTLLVTRCGKALRRFSTSQVEPEHLELCDDCIFADYRVPVVYRCFDAAGVLLYVGSSADFLARLRAHAAPGSTSAVWCQHAARWTVEIFDDLEGATKAEDVAIRVELPLFNVKGRRPESHSVGEAA